MSIKSVAHACIKTSNLNATSDFYCGALGMTKHFNFVRKGKVIGFYMKAGNATFVEVFDATEVEKVGMSVLSHFCLEAESLEELRGRLIEKGYAPGGITMGADQTPQFWMKDPNGMDLEFQEYTEKSAQVTGQDVEVTW